MGDSRGRPTTATQGPRTRTTTYFSTSDTRNGYVQWVTNALSQSTSFSPDPTGRILQQLDPDGALTSFSWDGNGNLTNVTPPGQPAHGQSFTPVDLVSAYTPPTVPGVPAPSTLFAYNVDKQLTQTTRPDGLLVSRTYDSAGRLDLLTTPTGSVDYDYFGLTPCVSCAPGRLARITDQSGVVLDHSYDGPLLKSLTWSGAIAGSVTFGYDASFRVTSETVTVGATDSPVVFGYDNDDILICASPTGCSPGGTDALKLTLNAGNGLVTGSTHGVVTDTLTYNAFGELAIYTGKVGATEVFSEAIDTAGFPRDNLGRITRRVDTNAGVTTVWLYAYDARGRLSNVQKNGALYQHYDYDPNGNRTLLTTPSGTTIGTYDPQDRLLSYGNTTYTYTANGELRTKTDASGTTSYTYDVRGNLTQVDLPTGDVIQYLVDGRDRRVAKRKNGVLERAWLYRNQLSPVAELDGSGNLVARFVYGAKSNVPEYTVRGGVTYRVLSDHLGSPRALVDIASGAVAWRADFDAWGNRTLLAGAAEFLPFGFAGGMFDPETGLTRFGARDYDPTVGRWVSKDPITFRSGTTELYSYVGNDPVNKTDPDGEKLSCKDKCEIFFGVAGISCLAGCTYLSANPKIVAACIIACLGAVYGITEHCKSECKKEEEKKKKEDGDEEEPVACGP
ncbi:MAG: RHS domain-containing protein [Myxococcales bacterium]|nr:RHS domain-containing protein [Myxococcales bacterium]